MNSQIFFDHFERLADAPQSIARLRELVLQLAVRGKLVVQDERDEPAARLLERIAVERKRLVREKKIREAMLPPVSDAEKPFETPQGWLWARFGEVTINRDGERVPIEKSIREYRQGEYDYYGASGVIDKFDDYIFDKPLLLIGEDGANLINRSTPIAFIAYGNYWVNNHAHVLDSISLDCLKYLELYINATNLLPYITGTAQPKMNQAKMNSIPVAVPPLEEQKRIVAKVDELMRLCDELERRQLERRETRSRLNHVALDQLLAASDAEEFQARWHTIHYHFTTLTATPDMLGKLRQTVLQLAVQGKLTRQDPQDEPATSLLRRIRAERERLIKEKRLKRTEQLPPVNPDEIPFTLPSGWMWARLDEILLLMDSGWSPTCKEHPTVDDFSWGVLKTTAVQNMRYDKQAHKELPSDLQPRPEFEVKKGDLLITRAGPKQRVGICCYVDETRPHLMISDKIIRFHLFEPFMYPAYIALCLNTGYSQHFIESQKSGMAVSQMNISQLKLRQTPIAVPPLEEQKRIVAAVNRLKALCDEMEAGLSRAEVEGERLLRVVVRSLLASASEISAVEANALVVQ